MADVNRTLKGWFGYFQHSVKNVFPTKDQWVRQRLRTVVRRRHKGKAAPEVETINAGQMPTSRTLGYSP